MRTTHKDTDWPEARDSSRRVLISAGGGVAISLLILIAIAQAQKPGGDNPPPLPAELRAVALPPPPPPVPESTPALQPASLDFELEASPAPSPGAIRLSASPPALKARPTVVPNLALSAGDFRPPDGMNMAETNRIFRRTEVDQVAVAVFKKQPQIDGRLLKGVSDPKVTLLFAVNRDGTVGEVRVINPADPEIDRLVAEAIRGWKFTPARRRGKAVRQWCQLRVAIQRPSSNPFSVE